MATSVDASRVYVPEWEVELRAVTFDDDIGKAPDLIIGAHVQDAFRSNHYAYPPHQSDFDGRKVWQFVIHGVIFVLKLDRRPYQLAKPIVLGGDNAVFGYVNTIKHDEWRSLGQIAKRMSVPRRLT